MPLAILQHGTDTKTRSNNVSNLPFCRKTKSHQLLGWVRLDFLPIFRPFQFTLLPFVLKYPQESKLAHATHKSWSEVSVHWSFSFPSTQHHPHGGFQLLKQLSVLQPNRTSILAQQCGLCHFIVCTGLWQSESECLCLCLSLWAYRTHTTVYVGRFVAEL